MKIVVIGGTGLIGSKVVKMLTECGHLVVAASPNNGVNSVTGEGLADAVAGASVVIDVSNSPANGGPAAMAFFTSSGRNLLAAEGAAGVGHHITLSIVGADRTPGQGYFEAKVAQEQLVEASGLPFTIVRSTQFFEFLAGLADANTIDGVIRVPPGLLQPVAADDLASYLVEVALNDPLNRTVEVAGPDQAQFEATLARYLTDVGDKRPVLSDPDARYFGSRLDEKSLVPLGDVHLGRLRVEDWISGRQGIRQPG